MAEEHPLELERIKASGKSDSAEEEKS